MDTSLKSIESRIDFKIIHASDDPSRTSRFRETVLAVYDIIEQKLYKETNMNIETYFKTHWNISRAQAYRLYNCGSIVRDLSEYEIQPSRERYCRILKKVTGNKEDLKRLWGEVLRRVENKESLISSSLITSVWNSMMVKEGDQERLVTSNGDAVPRDSEIIKQHMDATNLSNQIAENASRQLMGLMESHAASAGGYPNTPPKSTESNHHHRSPSTSSLMNSPGNSVRRTPLAYETPISGRSSQGFPSAGGPSRHASYSMQNSMTRSPLGFMPMGTTDRFRSNSISSQSTMSPTSAGVYSNMNSRRESYATARPSRPSIDLGLASQFQSSMGGPNSYSNMALSASSPQRTSQRKMFELNPLQMPNNSKPYSAITTMSSDPATNIAASNTSEFAQSGPSFGLNQYALAHSASPSTSRPVSRLPSPTPVTKPGENARKIDFLLND
eukprot:Partr_v1_DN28317_c1_g1_i1_m79306